MNVGFRIPQGFLIHGIRTRLIYCQKDNFNKNLFQQCHYSRIASIKKEI